MCGKPRPYFQISSEKDVKDNQVKCNSNKQLNCDNLMQLKKHAKSNIRKRDTSVFTMLQNVLGAKTDL